MQVYFLASTENIPVYLFGKKNWKSFKGWLVPHSRLLCARWLTNNSGTFSTLYSVLLIFGLILLVEQNSKSSVGVDFFWFHFFLYILKMIRSASFFILFWIFFLTLPHSFLLIFFLCLSFFRSYFLTFFLSVSDSVLFSSLFFCSLFYIHLAAPSPPLYDCRTWVHSGYVGFEIVSICVPCYYLVFDWKPQRKTILRHILIVLKCFIWDRKLINKEKREL